ncbi:hypothetical protein LOAG_04048 [Loa loa]|nr:hypothetical protein LOAG_04048 [Loa loa]EFO24440.2 hypothetical protein LOAG_04048 [Loa loa]
MSQADIDVNLQHIEKGMQELSFASDVSVTAPNFTLTSSLSTQTSVDVRSNFYCGNSATSFDSNPDTARPVEQKQYQLWSTPPWNALLEQGVNNNQANITSTWNSLLDH